VQAEPAPDRQQLLGVRAAEQVVVHAVVGHVDVGRIGADDPHELVPGGLGRHDQAGGPAPRGADGRLVERRGQRAVRVRLGKERQVVHGDDRGHARPQWHRVVRGVNEVCVHLLRDQRQAALLPGQPGGPVRDGRRGGHDLGPGHQPSVPLLVSPLAGNGQVGPRRSQGTDQAVHVAAVRTAVRRDRSRVNENTRRHDQSGSFRVSPSHTAIWGPGRGITPPVRSERTPSATSPRPPSRANRAWKPGRNRASPIWPRSGRLTASQRHRYQVSP
jgi:hypothetical protein